MGEACTQCFGQTLLYLIGQRMVTARKVVINSWLFFVAKTNTAIAVSSVIKEIIQKQALATRLTQKEVVYLGMLAIDALDKEKPPRVGR